MFFNSPVTKRSAAVIILFTLLILPACSSGVADKRPEPVANTERVRVRAVPVKAQEFRRNVESVGSLFALEEVTVSSEVEGKVDEVLVDIGDHVERGQP